MSGAAKIFWTVIIVLFAAGAVASQFIPVLDTGLQIPNYTINAGELTVDTLVGQTFTAEQDRLAGVSVMFATYSGRENTKPVRFHLRASPHSREDIRTGEVNPGVLGDNQFHTFQFEPISDSAGKHYFFFVVSPESTPGDAVTVDLDSRDPYHLGTAFLVRGDGPDITNPSILDRSGKQTLDVAFGLQYEVPLRVAAIGRIREISRAFIVGWDTQRDVYVAYGWATAAAGLFLVLLGVMQQRVYVWLTERVSKRALTVGILSLVLMAGLLLRIQYASELPLTNDEGNYLYDAWAVRQGILAGGDGYVKAPLVIGWVVLWQRLLGDTITAGRMASIVAGLLTAIPIYFLAKYLWTSRAITQTWLPLTQEPVSFTSSRRWGRRVGLMAAAAWALLGSSVVSDIYVHTQPVALFFAVSGLALLLGALRGAVPRFGFYVTSTAPAATKWFILAGILLGLGVASRKSVLALGLVPILLVLLESRNWRFALKHVLGVGIGFLLVVAVFLGGAFYVYGPEGIVEAIGYNSAEDGIGVVDPDEADQVRAYSLRGMTPFFREGMPLILLSILGLGFSLEYALRALLTKIPDIAYKPVLVRFAWVLAWLVFIWAWRFFFEYEGAVFMRYGITFLWWAFGGLLAVATFWPDAMRAEKRVVRQEILVPITKQPGFHGQQRSAIHDKIDEEAYVYRHIAAALLVPVWVGGLVFFYMNWIKFHANYISEFIPPLIILAAFGVLALYRRLGSHTFWRKDHPWADIVRRVLIAASVVVIGFAIVTSNFITFFFEHTGTFHQGAVDQAALWARQHIPAELPIFTGAAVIPYLSGHHTALDIAHPRWYAYEFTRKDTQRLNTFLPPIETMLEAYRSANWFLLEKQTGFSFLMEYTEIEAGLERDWEKIHEIENGGNTLTFYRRVQ